MKNRGRPSICPESLRGTWSLSHWFYHIVLALSFMCSVNLRYWQHGSFTTESLQKRTSMLHLILAGKNYHICIKCFQSENCCVTGYFIWSSWKKQITRVLSDLCLGSRKGSPEVFRILINMVVSISGFKRNYHNCLLVDFSPSKGNLNNPWLTQI